MPTPSVPNLYRLTISLAMLSTCLGCSLWKPWSKADDPTAPQTRPDLADSDETFKQPLRPKHEKKRSKWDISTYLDTRTQSIEDSLGL